MNAETFIGLMEDVLLRTLNQRNQLRERLDGQQASERGH